MTELFFDIYRDRRVLVTGHTGFKGSWLALWLKKLGAHLHGYSMPAPTTPSHWDLLGLDISQSLSDINDMDALTAAAESFQPEIIFHLAAQSLVRDSYRKPLDTLQTNIMGTAHILELARCTPSVKACVIITTDKCYQNVERETGYVENDRLGGHDPYSTSKACAEFVTASYRASFFQSETSPLIATCRGGNAIGGGDWGRERLVPDLALSAISGTPVEIRYPQAIRPWQHVLDLLYGYLLLGSRLLAGERNCAEAWNFGPAESENYTVQEFIAFAKKQWPALRTVHGNAPKMHESNILQVNSDKARFRLGWHHAWPIAREGIAKTIAWYRAYYEEEKVLSESQLEEYTRRLAETG